MSNGEALTDEDRWPWLEALRNYIHDHAETGQGKGLTNRPLMVTACSSLKKSYRTYLRDSEATTVFIFCELLCFPYVGITDSGISERIVRAIVRTDERAERSFYEDQSAISL